MPDLTVTNSIVKKQLLRIDKANDSTYICFF